MPRKHVFVVTVLLGAIVVAGLFAVTRTLALSRPSAAATGTDPAIAFRLAKLDRFEASLERRAAKLRTTARPVAPVTVYRRSLSPQVAAASHDDGDDEGDHHESEDSDD